MNLKDESTHKEMPASIPKVQTCIRGLDEILFGGLPAERITIISGEAGSGKTVLAMEFIYRKALAGDPGIFLSFEESAGDLIANVAGMGMDIQSLENSGKLRVVHAEIPENTIHSGEFDTRGLLAMIEGHAGLIGARYVVIDAVDVLMWLFKDPEREREEIYSILSRLRKMGMTTIMTVKADPSGSKIYPFLDFMADCVLKLDQLMLNRVRTRSLSVMKYRGSNFLSNEHPYVFSKDGLVFLPLSSMSLEQFPFADRVSSGLAALDERLGGGYYKGSSVLLAGPTGSGKTSLACVFAHAACSRGEKVLYLDFEVAAEVLVSAVRSIGLDIKPAMEGETRLNIMTALPETLEVEQHLLRVINELERFKPDHLVIDAISAARRMGSEKDAFDFAVRLMLLCKVRNITSIFLNQTTSEEHLTEISGIGVSSLVDAIIALEYFYEEQSMSRRLAIIKSRGSAHSTNYCGMRITDAGIRLCEIRNKEDETSTGNRRP